MYNNRLFRLNYFISALSVLLFRHFFHSCFFFLLLLFHFGVQTQEFQVYSRLHFTANETFSFNLKLRVDKLKFCYAKRCLLAENTALRLKLMVIRKFSLKVSPNCLFGSKSEKSGVFERATRDIRVSFFFFKISAECGSLFLIQNNILPTILY